MRTFSCFIFEKQTSVPGLTFIFAATLERARELARRELSKAKDAIAVEICEGGQLLWTEPAAQG
jgi:hypothetical protein